MDHRITMSYLRSWLTYQSFSQAYFIITLWWTFRCSLVSDQFQYTFEGLWYFLRGYRPSKTDPLKLSFVYYKVSFSLWFIKVFHWRLHSLVFYTKSNKKQYQITVKLHRVFASSGRQTASARLIQFHWEASGDSRAALPHSCRTTFNGQGISLLSDPYG